MKSLKQISFKHIIIFLVFTSIQQLALAADKIPIHNEDWYLQSWVWVLGGAVLLLLILALLGNNNQSTKS